MVIGLPLGFFATAAVLDIVYLTSGRGGFATASGHVIGLGLVAGLVAAVLGLAACTTIPRGARARRTGIWLGAGNVVVLVLFGTSWLIRVFHSLVPGPAALVCGLAGLALAGVTGWLGGDLVERLRTGRLIIATVPRQQFRK